MKIKFTRGNIEALVPPPEGELFAWSADKPGWGLRILASGRKSWIVQFRGPDGKSRRHTLGDLRIVSIAQAEQRATEILSHAKLGRDLLQEEREKRERRASDATKSIGALVAGYLAESEVLQRRSFGEIERYLSRIWKPVHLLSAESVDRTDLAQELRVIAHEHGQVSANRARSALSALFTWAIRHGRIKREASPTTYLPVWKETPRERALSLEELGKIWRAAPEINETFGAIVRLLILTGARRSEIADLRWSEVDLERAQINLPGVRTKNKRPHMIPLAPAALEVIQSAPKINTTLVFVGFASWSHAKRELDRRLGLEPFVLHDIRRTAATGLREHVGADTHLVELLLNHVSGSRGGIAGTYDRSERLAEKRRALEAWARLVLQAAGAPVGAAQVVHLR